MCKGCQDLSPFLVVGIPTSSDSSSLMTTSLVLIIGTLLISPVGDLPGGGTHPRKGRVGSPGC